MKVAIINKSDSTGGAAVVSFRLMEALRAEGVDAYMLVAEKKSISPHVYTAAKKTRILYEFLKERLGIFLANGFNRSTLFKIDTATSGLPLWRHPLVKEADAIFLNWVNQGMLSLKGFRKLLSLGKPVVWTMHDMWCFTGICHHAGECVNFMNMCGDCYLLKSRRNSKDLSFKIFSKKNSIYSNINNKNTSLTFVAVSSWLLKKTAESSLLKDCKVVCIPNAFNIPASSRQKEMPGKEDKIRLAFGAARLDDPIKGFDILKEMTKVLKEKEPEIARRIEIVLFGNIKNPEALSGFSLPLIYQGSLPAKEVKKIYENAHLVVSASSYETLPGTLVEAQAYGCIPVSFNQGGQSDIIEDSFTGFLAEYNTDKQKAATNLAIGVIKAMNVISDAERFRAMIAAMKENVRNKFSYNMVAKEYISLIRNLERV